MSPLQNALAEYLQIRRALGYKLERAEKLLPQYLDYLDGRGEQLVTIENALAWATLPGRRCELVGVPAVGGARVRVLPARARPDARGAARGSASTPDAAGDPIPVLRPGDPRADGGDQLAASRRCARRPIGR